MVRFLLLDNEAGSAEISQRRKDVALLKFESVKRPSDRKLGEKH